MSYLHRPPAGPDEPDTSPEAPRSPFADVAGRFANWIAGVERMPDDEADDDLAGSLPDPMQQLSPSAAADEASRFPVAALGYNRAVVDEYVIGLEREIAELRAREPKPMSINEELARIGEQTASILVVAHNQASETTRLAEEQAERCVADAAANAVAITNEAKQRLRELDTETDSVWRERERLLQDVRSVSEALASLADEAAVRFPADADGTDRADGAPHAVSAGRMAPQATEAFPIAAGYAVEDEPVDADPQATVAFTPQDHADYGESMPAAGDQDGRRAPGPDTATWLTGLEPPDSTA